MLRDVPAARPRRIFYGWYVIGVAMVGAFLCGGMTSQVFFSVMLKPLTSDLGWSRTEVTGAITLGTLAGGLLAPLAGALVDRFGPRFIAPLGAIAVSASLIVLSQVESLVVFYVSFILARGLSSTAVTGVVSSTLAANWFRRMRGRAFGLIAMAVPLGGSAGALAAQPLIEGPGWRSVFIVFPALLLVTFVLPAVLIYRRRPEEVGLVPDGDTAEALSAAGRVVAPPEDSWTLREATRTRALWLLIAGLFIGTLANGAVSFHLVAYYTDKGMSSTVAAAAISLYAFCGAIANFVWGFLVERVSERLLLAVAMIISGLSLLLTLPVQAAAPALAVAALYGLAARGEGTLVNTVIAQYYGRESYGRIAGMVSPFNMAALGLGPLLASISFDVTGSYTAAFGLFSTTYLSSAALLWLARKPSRPVVTRAVIEEPGVGFIAS
jgi:OFA family oxalate/formate antiporter-like MFS transporter